VTYFDGNKTGQLVSRIMSDVEGMRNLVGTGLIEFFGGLLTAFASLTILLKNDQALGDTTPTNVTLGFYNNKTTYGSALPGSVTVPVSLPSTKIDSNGGGAFTLETLSGIAPAGATFAGVELSTTGTYIVDNASIIAVPEPGTLALLVTSGLPGAAWMIRRRRR